ncbi:Peptidase_S10 domain-containing protein [Cephalotus follicularis]|uniref:Peptidase_S10 domain-containing protein n=1 Tax=Cephalotus follicularis TaxID=3775 RepID=A0A1Q3BC35_CEPFO|nr:Peptidase_S10 domain-containing protein [Cephalotus follicularis]
MMPSTFIKFLSWVYSYLLLLLLLPRYGESGSIVKYLPGFPGELPFVLESGYISVNESELFYLFVESQGKPTEDPLIIYLIGGPGCSGFNGFFFQTGPLSFNSTDYSGGLPSLVLNPYSWTKTASIIYIDAPVSTGFSYATSWENLVVSDYLYASQIYVFIRKWLLEHPKFITNPFFMASDSYAGIMPPIVSKYILIGNAEGLLPRIKLVGFLSGSPHTDGELEVNSRISFAHQMALIPDGLYQSAKTNCDGDYTDIDANNTACLEAIQAIEMCLDRINEEHVLDPLCATISPRSNYNQLRRSVKEKENHSPTSKQTDYWCRYFPYLLLVVYANDKSVQEALNVREGTIDEWVRCNVSLAQYAYTYEVGTVVEYHQNLTSHGLQVLMYSGDHDMVVPHISTESWISSLELTVDDYWRPWFVDGQVAGYTVKYTNYGYRLTYATVKGSGHSPTEFKPKESFEMFKRPRKGSKFLSR